MAELVTRTQLAKMIGCQRGGVTRALDGKLGAAMVGQKIDTSHPEAVAYINTNKARLAARAERDQRDNAPVVHNAKVEKYMDLTLRDIVSFFGTDIEFIDWIKAVKAIEDVKEKRIKNEVSLNNLIPRDYVSQHVFSMLDTVNTRLLTDSPRTIAARVIEAHNSGETREKIEKLICDLLSVQIKGIKLRARRALHE